MATTTSNTDFTRWTSAVHNHRVAGLAWSAVDLENECPARDNAAEDLVEARSLLFAVPSLTLSNVAEKLRIYWGARLLDDTYEMAQHRMLIGDLTRLELEQAGAAEFEASGRSPDEAAKQAEEWRAALTDYLEEERLFVEGPSLRWDGREAIELVDAMDYAAGTLLGLPAPNLGGVVRKMELLWETDRFDSVEAGSFCQFVIRDMNRLARVPTAR